MKTKSKQRWLALWQRLHAQGDPIKVYNDLVVRYSEPHRAYHTFKHIEACLKKMDQVRYLAVNPDAVEFALWFHDSFYDVKAKDNEERSATFANEVIRTASLSTDFGNLVSNLIMATNHKSNPIDPDAQLLTDIDLSILCQSRHEFDRYEQQIRKEYGWVDDATFIVGRSAILKSFLDRPTIYSTQFFQNKCELKARQNIVRSLTRLENH